LIRISPDSVPIWTFEGFTLNATIVFTWVVMAILVILSWLGTRHLKAEGPTSRWQNFLEAAVFYIRNQLHDIMGQKTDLYLPFIGGLFLFISMSNLIVLVPLCLSPTASLSTTAALATCVFFAVPIFGVMQVGWKTYFKHYVTPTFLMFPFYLIGEFTRSLALAVRLFGNIMSEALLGSIILVVMPLFFPVLLDILGFIIGQVQAYIFSVLAAIYIASGLTATIGEQK
jgi:F-type H+-transporting ATPase subunit a